MYTYKCMYVEKGKTEERYVGIFDDLSYFIVRLVSTSKFLFEYKNILSKLFQVWEIIITDKFLFQLEVFIRANRCCYMKTK